MVTVYVDSVDTAGKTAFCAGLGRRMLRQGKTVGFFMPLKYPRLNGDAQTSIEFLKQALGLTDADDKIAPATMPTEDLWKDLTEDTQSFIQRTKKDFAGIAKNKDVVLVEGLGGMVTDNVSTLACYTVAEALDSKVIIMLRYSPQLAPELLARVSRELGDRLLGIVINLVPESRIQSVREVVRDRFAQEGIRVLGVLPEIRALLGITVEELSEVLEGEMVVAPQGSGDIVEDVMVGAMTMDSGRDYFRRKERKAVIIRGERADMQLAALDTSVTCMVLTDSAKPLAPVVAKAEQKKVPVIISSKDTAGVIAAFEKAFLQTSFNSGAKLTRFEQLLEQYLDFEFIDRLLGQET